MIANMKWKPAGHQSTDIGPPPLYSGPNAEQPGSSYLEPNDCGLLATSPTDSMTPMFPQNGAEYGWQYQNQCKYDFTS